MRILYMGTPDFAEESLKCIYEAGHEIIGVVTNVDKPKGRGMKMIAPPVKEYALEKGLKVYQPIKVRNNEEFIDEIKELNPDLIVVVAYGKILPKEILEIPKYGCINVHASLLPKYRGAAPIQWAVINGDEITGVTTMYMDEGMDTGDMILTKEVKIDENETLGELWDRLSKIGGELLVETVKQIENNTVKRTKQPENFTMAPMLDKSMAKIEWKEKTAKEIKNLVRGLNPIMGAYTFLEEKKIKFWKVDAITEETFNLILPEEQKNKIKIDEKEVGEVLFAQDKKGLFIKANEGIISVLEIQGENAKKMPIGDFLRGNVIKIGTIFN